LTSPLFAPVAQVAVVWRLAKQGFVQAAMDNSDGLLPTLAEIALASNVSVEIDLASLTVPDSDSIAVDPARLWLGWGDWNVVVCIRADDFELVKAETAEAGSEAVLIGRCCAGPGGVFLRRGEGLPQVAPRLDSERFVPDSWFRTGLGSYVDALLTIPLPVGDPS
jgi:thiamine-monophosphate kinase